MAGPRGYNTYRGRKPLGKIILAVVLVLIILAAVGFLLLQKYVVYDDSGRPHWELPEKSTAGETSSAQPDSSADDLEITIQKPEEQTQSLMGIQLGSDPSAWKAAVDGLTAAGQNAFCVTMKTDDGQVQYLSAVSGVSLSGTAADASVVLPELLKSDAYSIARISCLRDSLYAKANVDAAGLKNTGGYIFYDGNNENWLDPAKQGTRDYLCALAKECASMGFDEILLTDLSYPTVGKLSKIDYGSDADTSSQFNDHARQLSGCLQAIQDALKGSDVKLSIELSEAVLSNGGIDETAGIDFQNTLADYVDRVYVPTTQDKVDALAKQMKDKNTLIPELSAAPTLPGYNPYLLVS